MDRKFLTGRIPIGKCLGTAAVSVFLAMAALLRASAAQIPGAEDGQGVIGSQGASSPTQGENGGYATIIQEETEGQGGFFGEYYTPSQGGGVTYLPADYDMTYSGPLDGATGGIPEGDSAGETQTETSGIYKITEKLSYDPEKQQYVNYIHGNRDKYFYSSVPPGIVTNGMVSFQMGNRSQYVLYRNGERVNDADVSNIVEEGGYILECFEQGGVEAERFEFTILLSQTNSMEQFVLPEGFRFTAVTVNGENAAVPYGDTYHMPSDGRYVFQFGCEEISSYFVTEVRKDTVAPRLEIVGPVDGRAKGPVTLTVAAEEETAIQITRDGVEIGVPIDMVLDDYGEYVVVIQDNAGNRNEYRFTIELYFTMTSLLVFLLLAAIAAGLFGYYKYVKNHLRIR